jgi:hypothetical protein
LGLLSPKEIQLQSYLELRRSTVMSDTEQHHDASSVMWQQDGVPSHFGRNVRATSFRNFLFGRVTVGQLTGPQHLKILNLAIFPCAVQSKAKCIARSCPVLHVVYSLGLPLLFILLLLVLLRLRLLPPRLILLLRFSLHRVKPCSRYISFTCLMTIFTLLLEMGRYNIGLKFVCLIPCFRISNNPNDKHVTLHEYQNARNLKLHLSTHDLHNSRV